MLTALSVAYNAPGFTKAHRLATQGKINRDSSWIAPSDPKSDDCLGVHTDATPGTKGRQAYPIIKGGSVYRQGVIAAKSRAAQQGETEIANACDKLLAIIDAKKADTSAKKSAPKFAAMRSAAPTAYSDKSLQVDAENGVLKNVALMTCGPALGHGFGIDPMTLTMMKALADAQPDGVKSRFKHPKIKETPAPDGGVLQEVEDDTGTQVARIKNARIDGDCLRGDVHIGSYAAVLPGYGDVKSYLINHADEDPAGIGMSAFFTYDLEPQMDEYGNVVAQFARPIDLTAFDFVGTPAANPQGLLSAKAGTFDPQPGDSSTGNPGWQDRNPKDMAKAPIPAGEFPNDQRGECLRALVKYGPLAYPALAARVGGRYEAVRAGAMWLVSHKYAEEVKPGIYKATPSGITKAAMRWQ